MFGRGPYRSLAWRGLSTIGREGEITIDLMMRALALRELLKGDFNREERRLLLLYSVVFGVKDVFYLGVV